MVILTSRDGSKQEGYPAFFCPTWKVGKDHVKLGLFLLRQRQRQDKLGLFCRDPKTRFVVSLEMAVLRVTQINMIEK